MKKKILSIMLILALLVSLLPVTYIYAAGEQFTLKIVPSVTKLNKGSTEEITYTIIGQGNSTTNIIGIEAEIEIPTSLTYVEGSGEIIEIADKIQNNLDGTEFVDDTEFKGIFIYNLDSFQLTEETPIATFKCKVNNDASGNIEVKAKNVVINNNNYEEISNVTTIDAITNVAVPVTGITINKTSLQLEAGNSEKLIASVEPNDATNQNISWKSDNTSVATVSSSGVVTAKGIGTATITATAENGKTATTTVKVICAHKNTTTHEAVASTCTVQGNEEYVTCDDCGELISGSDAKLDLAEHNYEYVAEVPATHTADELSGGVKAHYKCTVCGKIFDENYTEITEDELAIEAPTHTYDGYKADATYHWQECGCGNIIARAEHTESEAVRENEVKATCEQDGSYEEVVYCTECDKEISRTEKTIAATGHKEAEAVRENIVEATTEAKGSYEEVVYCVECGKELSRTTVVIPVKDETKPEETKPEEINTNNDTTEKVETTPAEENLAQRSNSSTPNTGDESNMALWISGMIVFGMLFVVVLKWGRKGQNPKRKAKHSL